MPALMHALFRRRLHLVCRVATVRRLDRATLHRSEESLAESRRALRAADRCLLALQRPPVAEEPAAMAAEAAETRRTP